MGNAMRDIFTVTVNPALDIATRVAAVVPGEKLRCAAPRVDPGGGGVNVARMIGRLDGACTALVACGGPTGQRLIDLLVQEGISAQPIPVAGETRTSFAVTDERDGAQYRFSVPGAAMTTEDDARMRRQIDTTVTAGAVVVLSGSMAPGLPVDFPSGLQSLLAPRDIRLVVDTSGPALGQLIQRPGDAPYLLRVDQAESEQAAGHVLPELGDGIAFARSLLQNGVADVIVSGRGAAGSFVVGHDEGWFCPAPSVPVASKIGAGDAFVGAMTLQLSRGTDLAEALRWGVAASSATVSTEGTALCTRQAVDQLLPVCQPVPC